MENILKAVFATVDRVVISWNNWNRRKEWERLTTDMNVVLSPICSITALIPGHLYVCVCPRTLSSGKTISVSAGSLQIGKSLYLKEFKVMKHVEYGYL